MTIATPIRIVRVAHVRYRHVNLEETKKFLEDFGMRVAYTEDDGKTLYFAGHGPDPYCYVAEQGETREFLGGSFLVETKEDLERASATLPSASKLEPAGPAGGYRVTFRDPDNIPVNLVWGLKEVEPDQADISGEIGGILDSNFPLSKKRKGAFRRFEQQPCPVYKLGHFGLLVTDFERTFKFYTTHFNLKPTDILTAPDGTHVAAFCHVDREETWVDHHTFFFSLNNQRTGIHHSSFEVHNPDIQAIGHDWLKRQGYQPAWGVGRHILGSQVFDYWYTPDEFLIEHYSDGDLVDCNTETGYVEAGDKSLAIWGPAVPEGFGSAIPPKKKAIAA